MPDRTQPRILELLANMLSNHADGVDCFTCGERMDCVAELAAAGGNCEKAWPAIHAHLQCCARCNEEFRALVAVLNAQRDGQC